MSKAEHQQSESEQMLTVTDYAIELHMECTSGSIISKLTKLMKQNGKLWTYVHTKNLTVKQIA